MQRPPDPRSPLAATPYSGQLQAGFRWLRFSPALEGEYRDAGMQTLRTRMRWASVLALAIWAGFSLFDWWRIPTFAAGTSEQAVAMSLRAVRVAVTVALLAAVLCSHARWRFAVLHAAFTVVVAALACGSAYSVYAYKLMALPDETSVLVLVMLAIFMPLGLSLYSQLAVAVSYVAAVEVMALSAPLAPVGEAMLRIGVVLTLSLVVLAFGAYWREYLQREQFLLRGDMHWMAMRDALTGLFNRRMFTHHLERAMRQAQRDARSLALLLVDIDHFKRYNDHHGHPAGDVVLQQVAAAVARSAARPLDMAVRLGGEEFALVLYDCDAAHAHHAGDALVDAVAQLALAHPNSPVAPFVTVSAGCAMLRPGERPEDLYTRADEALYGAKTAGRNRCHGPQRVPSAEVST